VPIEGGYIFELTVTEIALNGLVELHDVEQVGIHGAHKLWTELLLLDLHG